MVKTEPNMKAKCGTAVKKELKSDRDNVKKKTVLMIKDVDTAQGKAKVLLQAEWLNEDDVCHRLHLSKRYVTEIVEVGPEVCLLDFCSKLENGAFPVYIEREIWFPPTVPLYVQIQNPSCDESDSDPDDEAFFEAIFGGVADQP